jgi:hypothetical protein
MSIKSDRQKRKEHWQAITSSLDIEEKEKNLFFFFSISIMLNRNLRYVYMRSFKRKAEHVGKKKDENQFEEQRAFKQFTVQIGERNAQFKRVKVKPANVEEAANDKAMALAFNRRMRDLNLDYHRQFKRRLQLKMQAIDALPPRMREAALQTDLTPPPPYLSPVQSLWPPWLDKGSKFVHPRAFTSGDEDDRKPRRRRSSDSDDDDDDDDDGD